MSTLFQIPYVPIMGPDGPIEQPEVLNTRYGRLHKDYMTLYFFISDGSVLADKKLYWLNNEKLDDNEYIKEAAIADPPPFWRMAKSIKILVHHLKSNRWICIKDAGPLGGGGPYTYEMTDKEQTLLALTAELV